ncbi:MAG TPA: 50S ribosomal protein L17 [Elusimicrobiota bacterium]|nr:50S ribosomal protein L17 [Elusimicrobiota bacterium]
MKTHAGRKLSRPTGARMSLLRNMAASLFRHEQMRTTYPKAREVSRFAEHVLAVAKTKTLTAYRQVGADIPDKEVRRKIFDVLVPRYQTRPGGCTRIHRLGRRLSDGAEVAVIKLIQ